MANQHKRCFCLYTLDKQNFSTYRSQINLVIPQTVSSLAAVEYKLLWLFESLSFVILPVDICYKLFVELQCYLE